MDPSPLDHLKKAAQIRSVAKQEYDKALLECIEAGVSNVAMAKACGVTEAAIRMYRKRKLHG